MSKERILNELSDELSALLENAEEELGRPLYDDEMEGLTEALLSGLDEGEAAPISNVTTNSEGVMDREDKINYLTANCDCWGNAGDRGLLEKFSDTKLDSLVATAAQAKEDGAVANAAKEGFRHDGRAFRFEPTLNTFVTNAPPRKGAAAARVPPDDPEDVLEPDEGGGDDPEDLMEPDEGDGSEVPNYKKRKPMATNAQPMKLADWMKVAPPEVQATVNYAMGVEQQARKALVDRIVTANAATAEGQAAIRPVYEKMDLPTLTVIANALPAPAQTFPNMAGYFTPNPVAGQIPNAGGFATPFLAAATPPAGATTNAANDDDDYLPIPTVNWSEGASPKLQR